MSDLQTISPANTDSSAAKAWLRGLELTAPISKNPGCVISTVIEDLAVRYGDAPALLFPTGGTTGLPKAVGLPFSSPHIPYLFQNIKTRRQGK